MFLFLFVFPLPWDSTWKPERTARQFGKLPELRAKLSDKASGMEWGDFLEGWVSLSRGFLELSRRRQIQADKCYRELPSKRSPATKKAVTHLRVCNLQPGICFPATGSLRKTRFCLHFFGHFRELGTLAGTLGFGANHLSPPFLQRQAKPQHANVSKFYEQLAAVNLRPLATAAQRVVRLLCAEDDPHTCQAPFKLRTVEPCDSGAT